MIEVCIFCSVKKWSDETRGFRCAGAKVVLHTFENPPDLIKSLIVDAHLEYKYFLNDSRRYNILFQMTSSGAKEIQEGNFMPTFKIHDQVYDKIGSLFFETEENLQYICKYN